MVNPSLKDVNARVDKLAEQFQLGLSEFKNEIIALKSPVVQADQGNILDRFKLFESTMNSSLSKLRQDVNKISDDLCKLNKKVHNIELKKNQNAVIIHGINEDKANLYTATMKVIQEKLGVQLNKNDINQCYRLGKKTNDKPRPIYVSFCQRWLRDEVFYSKKKLKGTSIMLTEMLTEYNLKIFKKARHLKGNSAWTFGGLVYVATAVGKKLISAESDLVGID